MISIDLVSFLPWPLLQAPTETENAVKNNRSQAIQLRYQTITAMKEYSGKSVEVIAITFRDVLVAHFGWEAEDVLLSRAE